ncbi:hypothetical protein [Methylibium rhizosphaerae]|uniref:hypothetical protein n=1 Tax=Methylibium rhizosphaerae TaxID=2570323 RepID=UPI0015E48166|nr:hypothetical protein [Methylibium rhizosphaerae]
MRIAKTLNLFFPQPPFGAHIPTLLKRVRLHPARGLRMHSPPEDPPIEVPAPPPPEPEVPDIKEPEPTMPPVRDPPVNPPRA